MSHENLKLHGVTDSLVLIKTIPWLCHLGLRSSVHRPQSHLLCCSSTDLTDRRREEQPAVVEVLELIPHVTRHASHALPF